MNDGRASGVKSEITLSPNYIVYQSSVAFRGVGVKVGRESSINTDGHKYDVVQGDILTSTLAILELQE
jgi:hypothetical protein